MHSLPFMQKVKSLVSDSPPPKIDCILRNKLARRFVAYLDRDPTIIVESIAIYITINNNY